ncbi:MAG: aspartate aminotransferase family protein [Dehalococcoidia bacterium]|nr:aspartate aminotransferase family protein [Dehalococcoidia bacterium]
MRAGKRQPLTLVRGEGVRVWDEAGRSYLDFTAGFAVDSLGHCPPVVVATLVKQAATLLQVSNAFYSVPQVELAELLVEHSCLDRVYFVNSGAEANETAFKLARKWGKLHKDGAFEIIAAENSFHGRTMAAVSATGTAHYRDPFTPLMPGFPFVPYNDVDAIRAATNENTVAVLLEPVQGEGGVNIPAPDYLRKVRQWCDEHNLLLILDEVQTGMGRVGALFGYQRAGVEPDIMTLAKGLGSGVPIGAVLAKEHASVFEPGDHGNTFGGNPLMTAVGRDVLRYIIDHDIPANAERQGVRLMERLRGIEDRFPQVRAVRGQGLLCAIEFHEPIADAVNHHCIANGLLVNVVKPNALRFIPPLIITEEDVDEAMVLLERSLADAMAAPAPS